MKRAFLASALCGLLVVSSAANGGPWDALPSCYSDKLPGTSAPPAAELFVLIDQTTPLDAAMKQAVAHSLRPFLVADRAFTVVKFSAFTQGHYTDVMVSGRLDPMLNPARRDDTAKPLLAAFDRCVATQPARAAQLAVDTLKEAFAGSSNTIVKSDVLSSLREISARIRQSPAREKVVLIASDMLENSAVTSFYNKQAVRRVDPAAELKRVAEHKLQGDFDGARIYVLGAGVLPENKSGTKSPYREPQTMQALTEFWRGYFDVSNGKLQEFGQPMLLNPVR